MKSNSAVSTITGPPMAGPVLAYKQAGPLILLRFTGLNIVMVISIFFNIEVAVNCGLVMTEVFTKEMADLGL